MNKTFLIVIVCLCLLLACCHPSYKRLTKGNWVKDTIWVRYPDLPKSLQDTLTKYYESTFTVDTIDDLSDLISFDPMRQFVDVAYYDAYSSKFRIPFGRYFKIGKKKYFIHYSELKSPLIYYDNHLFFPSGVFFDKTIEHKLYSPHERRPYDKRYYVKYKLK